MLVIKTTLKESKGKGIGHFASENIKKDAVVSVDNPMFYKIISYYEYNQMPALQKEFIKKHATEYPDDKIFFLDLDDTRFINHSNKPNIEWSKTTPYAVAIKDIKKGDEILCDYTHLNPKDVFIQTRKKAK